MIRLAMVIGTFSRAIGGIVEQIRLVPRQDRCRHSAPEERHRDDQRGIQCPRSHLGRVRVGDAQDRPPGIMMYSSADDRDAATF